MRLPGIFAATLLFSTLPTAFAHAQTTSPITRLYVFGDSYSDIGEGYLDGNGPTAVAYFADHLDIKLYPSNTTDEANKSLDFAVSGAQTGSGKGHKIKDALLGYGMRDQVDDFAARVQSKRIGFDPKTTLFYLAGGLNDEKLPSETTVANLEGEIRTLYDLGARRFEVALLPIAIPGFADVGMRLNLSLTQIPAELKPQLPGAEIKLSYWGHFFDEVMQHPERYGIKNIVDACAGRVLFDEDATPCAHPETYFYYHREHPSTAVHKAVGQMLFDELKKPVSLKGGSTPGL
jgi:phospholipase/lecithinase/hemolysin